jgi:glycosyltransferase involved in cell wall biosynthesis
MNVSVVIPLFNKQDFVLKAITSVLKQKKVELELLVIDDGSTDNSFEIVNSVNDPRIRIFKQNNLGPSAARNRGMLEAKYPLIAFLDGDDFWAPTKLFEQAAYLEAHPEISAVYCQAVRVDVTGGLVNRKPFGYGIRDEGFLLKNLVKKPISVALGSTLMIRLEVLEKMGGFDEALVNGEDTDLELRLAKAGFKQHMISKPLTIVRFDASSLSRSFDEERWAISYRSHMLIYEKLLNDHPSEFSEVQARNKVLNVHLRQLLYYLLIGKTLAANGLRNRIIEERNLLDKNSGDFYTQIEFFTPLIYHRDGWTGLEKFIERVLDERDLILPNCENAIQDDLMKIKAIVWCAGQAHSNLKHEAWRFLFRACGKNFGLIINKDIWKQAVRLLVGNIAIWVNIRWWAISLRM